MKYPGGKNSSYHKIINQMGPHDIYLEPFVGSGAVLRMKRPALRNLIIDKSRSVVTSTAAACDFKVEAITGCGIEFLKFLTFFRWSGRLLVYADPPYMRETRSSKADIYEHEMTDEQHAELLTVLKGLDADVILSGYHSELYARELAAWRVETYEAITRGGTKRTEYLWMNFPPPVELHDYSFLGENRTQRQAIRRQRERWKDQLARMDNLKRGGLFSAIEEWRKENSAVDHSQP